MAAIGDCQSLHVAKGKTCTPNFDSLLGCGRDVSVFMPETKPASRRLPSAVTRQEAMRILRLPGKESVGSFDGPRRNIHEGQLFIIA
jgi:hypothetical protein